MQRIKVPFGGLDPAQMNVLADVAEEYSDGVCHVTTRQDIQLHYVHIDDTPALMWRLAAVGITTREACGNSVRNVTACPLAGVCADETFDVTPYARAISRFLLGHPDTQDFGRKFKVAFSGCREHACGLVLMHDLGAVAVTKELDGVTKRGFELFVGGGLGTVTYQAKLFDSFVSEEELLPLAQAIARVFARLGEKKNRNRARIKFLVAQLGIDEFRRLVLEERARLAPDDRWISYLAELPAYGERPLRSARPLGNGLRPEVFDPWHATNVSPQRQPGYSVAAVTLPLGDLTSRQMRQLGDIARRYVGGTVRTTVEQNIVLRWVSDADLPALYGELEAIGLGDPGAGTIVDITACPGTDTCKLGIASSRRASCRAPDTLGRPGGGTGRSNSEPARENQRLLQFVRAAPHRRHWFLRGEPHVGGYTVPHFQIVLGGQWDENAGAYGLAIGAVPSKNIPDALTRIADHYLRHRQHGETFQRFVHRIGKRALKEVFDDLVKVPSYEESPAHYTDWGDARVFTMGDMGTGECAGEIVPLGEFEMAAAEAQVFEAQIQLEEGNEERADALAYTAMLLAARGLVKRELMGVSEDPHDVVREFRARFYETQLFHDKYAGGKFAQYLFRRHTRPPQNMTRDRARQAVEEAQLFLEATHACRARLAVRPVSTGGVKAAQT